MAGARLGNRAKLGTALDDFHATFQSFSNLARMSVP
jgi:hypothetical protein